MTEWRRLELLKVERELLVARVAELVEELDYLRAEYAALERVALDLTAELAAVRLMVAAAGLEDR